VENTLDWKPWESFYYRAILPIGTMPVKLVDTLDVRWSLESTSAFPGRFLKAAVAEYGFCSITFAFFSRIIYKLVILL
jgi:hypothetical protein